MKKELLLCLCLAPLFNLCAQTVHVDFGRATNPTAGNYNNIAFGAGAGDYLLIDDAGADTGITLSYLADSGADAGAGADFLGPYPIDVAAEPASAIGDSVFIRSDNDSEVATMVLSGLIPTSTYAIAIYGARGNSGLEGIWNITDRVGENPLSISNVFNNETELATVEGLVPGGDASDEIVITFASSVSNTSGSGMNYMRIVGSAPVDSDSDGMPDFYETDNGTDPDFDDADEDEDMDGLSNLEEFLGQDAEGSDTGYGQTLSGTADTDGDGLSDGVEVSGSMNPYDFGFLTDPPGEPTNPNATDSDEDLLSDFEELDPGNGSVTDPNFNDTDLDGLTDDYEVMFGLDPTIGSGDDGGSGDPDMDNLTNFDESGIGTNPRMADTDGDNLNDDVEDSGATDPLLADTDGDLLDDGAETVGTTDPLLADSDGDGFQDFVEIEAGSLPDDIDSIPTFPSISWSVAELNDEALLSTEGTLLFAENANGETTTVNGIVFEGVSSSTTSRSSENIVTLLGSSANVATVYDDEVPGLSPLLETFWWSSGGAAINKVGVTGLTPGKTYRIEFGRSDDRSNATILNRWAFADGFGGGDSGADLGPGNTIYGGPGNPALLFSGTFVADSTVQVFSAGQNDPATDEAIGSAVSFLQVREIEAIAPSGIRVVDLRHAPGSFEVEFSGLDTESSYQLMRSTDMLNFSTVVDGPRTPVNSGETFTDSSAPVGKAFYRLEEVP